MGLKALCILSFFLGLAMPASGSPALQWKVVTELSRFEPFDALAFHDGVLWVGKSRADLGAQYSLEVYDRAGTLLEIRELEHSLRYLYTYGDNGIFTLGVSYKTNLTHYSAVTRRGTALNVKAVKIPLGGFANEFAGRPGAHYFTDPGGLDDGGPIGQPARTIFTMQGSRPRYLKARIPGPHYPTLVGNYLFVVENPTIASGGRHLVRVDLKTETPTRIYSGTDISNVLQIDGGALLALADRGAGEVVLVESATGKVAKRLRVESGTPRGLAVFGKCLAVGSESAKKVSFFDLRTDKLVSEWDLSVAGSKFYAIRSLAADYSTGRIYARSATPDFVGNPNPSPDRNSVVLAEETGGATVQACK